MAGPVAVDTLDERVARGIAFEVREIRDRAFDARCQTTYIPSYISDYLDDTAGVLRQLQACGGDSGAAVRRLVRTLEWREGSKVYPAKRRAAARLVVDGDGMVLVRRRRAPLLTAMGGRAGHTHGVAALEDARVGLQAAYEQFGVAAQAAVVVAVESVRLADASADAARELAAVAEEHYPLAVGRVYVTAASSVLLEHARLALQPALRSLDASQRPRIVFMLASMLDAETTELGAYMLRRQQQQRRAPRLSAVERVLSRSASSIFSSDAGDDDDFRSACEEPAAESDVEASLTPTQSVLSLEYCGKGTADGAAAVVVEAKYTLTPVQLASLQRAVQSVQRMLGTIGDGFGGPDPRMALAATRSKLAQQADVLLSTVAALSFGVSMVRPPLHAAPEEPAKQQACFIAAAEPDAAGVGRGGLGAWLGGLALQLLALPLGLVFGRRRDAVVAGLQALAARVARVAVRRAHLRRSGVHMLLLLAYKHLRVYAMVLWTGALLVWQANAALIWASLSKQWQRGIAY
ncbi:hypothetical protein H4R19_000919 [Coemansia spiralis]|nr:hypothetical protein H4R19_000919 [Coemansia spiralis]